MKSTWDEGFHNFFPDQTPVELPLGYEQPESLAQMIARMIQAADFRKMSDQAGVESFDESDDFDVEGDDEFVSEHEMSLMQEEYHVPRMQEEVEGEKEPKSEKAASNAKESGESKNDAKAPTQGMVVA